MDFFNSILSIIAIVLMAALLVIYRRARKLNAELLHERELLETLLNNIPDQIYFKDADSHFIKVNQSVANTLGVKSPRDAIGKTDADFFRAEDASAFRADDQSVMSSRVPLRDRVEHGIANGISTWMSTTKAPIFGPDSKAVGVVGISRDITERIRSQQQLSDVVSKARCILWNAHVTSVEGKLEWQRHVHSSEQLRKEFGLETMWGTQVDPTQMKKMSEITGTALASGAKGYQQEFWIRAKDGTPHWIKEDVQIAKVAENEWDLVGVSLDITERKQFEEQLFAANVMLERLAREDALTGLHNRRTILELAEMEWARWSRFGNPLSILMLDVDDFKAVNDIYGHEAGDKALRLIALDLKSSIRNVDRLGRYGGEEFVIVLPETTQDGAVTAGKKALCNIRSKALKLDQHTLNITVSIGVATAHKGDHDIATLLKRADQALLKAKRSGKNCIIAAHEPDLASLAEPIVNVTRIPGEL